MNDVGIYFRVNILYNKDKKRREKKKQKQRARALDNVSDKLGNRNLGMGRGWEEDGNAG